MFLSVNLHSMVHLKCYNSYLLKTADYKKLEMGNMALIFTDLNFRTKLKSCVNPPFFLTKMAANL